MQGLIFLRIALKKAQSSVSLKKKSQGVVSLKSCMYLNSKYPLNVSFCAVLSFDDAKFRSVIFFSFVIWKWIDSICDAVLNSVVEDTKVLAINVLRNSMLKIQFLRCHFYLYHSSVACWPKDEKTSLWDVGPPQLPLWEGGQVGRASRGCWTAARTGTSLASSAPPRWRSPPANKIIIIIKLTSKEIIWIENHRNMVNRYITSCLISEKMHDWQILSVYYVSSRNICSHQRRDILRSLGKPLCRHHWIH